MPTPRKVPTPAQLVDLPHVISGEWSLRRFQTKHGIHPETQKRWIEDYPQDTFDATTLADLVPAFVGFDNPALDSMIELQERLWDLDSEIDEVHWKVPDGQPSLIVYMSDLHMGHMRADHRAIVRDCETIRNTPGVYVVLGGDLIDNANLAVAGRGMFNESLTPAEVQMMFMDDLVGYLGRDKIIGMILGNHDEWAEKAAGYNPIRAAADRHGIPYLGTYGFVNIEVGGETYRLLVGHQFNMGNSRLNLTLVVKRFWEAHGDSATDATFLGHRHEGASEQAPKQGRSIFFGQAGSYLIDSRYGKRQGFGASRPKMPGGIIMPHEHDLIGVHDCFKHGIHMIDAFRKGYA